MTNEHVTDELLESLREAPREELARDLKRRLDAIEDEEASRAARRTAWARWRPVLAGAGALAVVVLAFSVPAVRASARSFLEMFRIQRFATVRVDTERLQKLQNHNIDLKSLVSQHVEVLEDPGEPRQVADVAAAEEETGMRVAQPTVLPHGSTLSTVHVGGAGHVRATVDVAQIEQLAQAMEMPDLQIPVGLDGAQVEMKTSPAVVLDYVRGRDRFVLFQSRSPQIGLPEGVKVQELGRIGLQLAGFSAEEARLFASKVDWRTTLLVPVPAFGADYRDVTVGGAPGLLVVSNGRGGPGGGHPHRRGPGWHAVLLWAKGDDVFALTGPGRGIELLEMANSVG